MRLSACMCIFEYSNEHYTCRFSRNVNQARVDSSMIFVMVNYSRNIHYLVSMMMPYKSLYILMRLKCLIHWVPIGDIISLVAI